MLILEMIGKCETFKEAKEAAKVLYEYCKGEVNQEQQTQNNDEEGEGLSLIHISEPTRPY